MFVDHVVLDIKGLTIKDSVIGYTGTTDTGNGALVGNNNGADYSVKLYKCHLDNVTVKNNNGDLRVGGFIGQQDNGNLDVQWCSVKNSIIEGNSSAGAIVGHLTTTRNEGSVYLIKKCDIENCTISATDDGSWRIGAIVGTVAGGGTLTIFGCGESRNTYTMDYSSSVNPGHNLYGRTVAADDGTATTVVVE